MILPDVRDAFSASAIQRASVAMTSNGVRFVMSSEDDIQDWIMPNFYFHIAMAYALLRNAGLAIGKMDFLPHMERHKVPATS